MSLVSLGTGEAQGLHSAYGRADSCKLSNRDTKSTAEPNTILGVNHRKTKTTGILWQDLMGN